MLNEGRITQEDASDAMVDAVTGLRSTETLFGRPDWENIFRKISLGHPR